MTELAKQYQKHKGMSLRAFARAAGVAYWQWRDYFKGQDKRQAKAKIQKQLKAQVKRLALKHPTYGYRRTHQEVLRKGWIVGEHKVREILSELDPWLERAKTSSLSAFKRFAKCLQTDYAAINAALSEPWSTGPIEGHINRLKMLKRQMYRRANLDLLEKRFLYAA